MAAEPLHNKLRGRAIMLLDLLLTMSGKMPSIMMRGEQER